jgi:5-bromo-4-chloroindolyl phosphate hydrolysis protein
MSQKNKDEKNRWRNKTVAFRMSPEEAEQLNLFVKLSGLAKQDYLIRRVLVKDVIVNGNPRVYKALRNQLESVKAELKRLERISTENDELLEIIYYISEILNGLQGRNTNGE